MEKGDFKRVQIGVGSYLCTSLQSRTYTTKPPEKESQTRI